MNYQIGAVWNRIIYVKGNFEYDSKQNNQLGCKGQTIQGAIKNQEKEQLYTMLFCLHGLLERFFGGPFSYILGRNPIL